MTEERIKNNWRVTKTGSEVSSVYESSLFMAFCFVLTCIYECSVTARQIRVPPPLFCFVLWCELDFDACFVTGGDPQRFFCILRILLCVNVNISNFLSGCALKYILNGDLVVFNLSHILALKWVSLSELWNYDRLPTFPSLVSPV